MATLQGKPCESKPPTEGVRDAHKYRAPLGKAGLGTWWRQVIESCYLQGSDSGVERGFVSKGANIRVK